MTNNSILKWYAKSGNSAEIAVSTRVRLARNIAEYPFKGYMTEEQQRELLDRAAAAVKAAGLDLKLIEMDPLSAAERRALVERHVISPDLAEGTGPRGVLVSADESISVMVGEEDHLRIQVFGPGLCPTELLKKASEIDDIFDRSFDYAYDEKLGYLTKCPTNLGTALRVSVMLHLPALAESGALQNLAQSAGSLGFAVRGLYGEGSKATGAYLQLSNRMTLGATEEELCQRIADTCAQMVEREKKTRISLYERRRVDVEDQVWRALGTLKYARKLSTAEAMNGLSQLRIGASLGLLDLNCGVLNDLLFAIQPASVAVRASAEGPEGRDVARASLLRETLKDLA